MKNGCNKILAECIIMMLLGVCIPTSGVGQNAGESRGLSPTGDLKERVASYYDRVRLINEPKTDSSDHLAGVENQASGEEKNSLEVLNEQDAEYEKLLNEATGEGADSEDISISDLFKYCRDGDIVALGRYIDGGGSPNVDLGLTNSTYSLLACAIVSKQFACASYLIGRGADVDGEVGGGGSILSLTRELLLLAKARLCLRGDGQEVVAGLSRIQEELISNGAQEQGNNYAEINNAIGQKILKALKAQGVNIVWAICRPNSITVHDNNERKIMYDDMDQLASWVAQQSSATNMVIAIKVHYGGELMEKKFNDMCNVNNMRVFTYKILGPHVAETDDQ